MGKKGKKKGKNVEESSEGEPSQPAAVPQPVQQQQQRQQQQQPQQQQEQRQPQQQQQPQQQRQQQQQPQQQQQQRQQQQQPQQQQPQQQRQAQQQQPAAVAEATQGIGQLHIGDGRGRGGLGRGGRGRGDQVRDGQGRGGQGRGGQGRGSQGSGPPPGGEVPQGGRRIPGMPQAPGAPAQRGPAWGAQAPPPQGDAGRGGQGRAPSTEGPTKQTASRASSTASARAGDTASVKSGGSDRAGGHKPVEKVSPVKVSLSAQLQMTYLNQIPKRKVANRGGTAGKPITVETNMIPIIFGKNFKTLVAHYDVKLDPDKPRFMYRPVVEAVRMKHYPKRYPVFDGRCNVFSAGDLPFGDHLTTEIEVENVERQRTMSFKVTLMKTQDIDMSWLPHVKPGFTENERSQIAIQALDVILRSSSIRQKAIPVGRSFFTPPAGKAVDLGNGMDLWIGTFQSAVLGWKPYFNVDVAHKAFPRSQQVIHLFNELCGDPRNPDRPITARDLEYGRSKLAMYLKGLKVTYEIPGHPSSRRTMGINDLGRSSREATFDLPDGSVTTVENYFLREKRYKIRYPEYPTLWVGPRNKTVLIPAELCVIEAGQVTNKKMDERQTSTMIKFAATDAQTRKRKILEGFAKMRTNEDPAAKEFGVSVGGGFETVQARVLNPPSLWGQSNILVRKGVWRADKFNSAVTLPDFSWTILNLNDRTQEGPLRNLVQCLKQGGRAVGMNIGEPLTPFTNMRPPMRDVREIIQFFNDKKEQGLKLVIVVVPEKGPVYSKVKQVAELIVGVLTQCIKAFTVERKMNDATAGNILLKINSKLNGTNQIFAAGKIPPCLQTPCMIVGADVTHPSPDSVGIPSIAAVAASHGPRAFKYNVKIRLQPPRTEIILQLEQIIKEQLMFFYKNTGQKPQRIIFYRDGVSEGQFPQVMHHELQAIRTACRKLGGSSVYEPKITFLVVQKRHHIRLFPTDPRNSDDRNGNVQAGTVVDTEITHPSHIDFYLVSHASIQGTARPTKYRCLWDDSDMSEDEIEQLTYYLCHMFSRCTRSVSYPAPTYYAHLAAFRARALTNEVEIRLNNLEEEQRTKMTIKDNILLGNPMFFV